MSRTGTIALGIALALVGCTSATKRYEQGEELQRAGRPADAADLYIKALKKDGHLDSARAALQRVGQTVVAQDLRTGADLVTNADSAAEAFVAIDDLRQRAREVGVEFVVPSDYADRRRAAFDAAIDNDVVDARKLTFRNEFGGAIASLERATSRYQPAPAQKDALDGGRADALIAWARADTAQGHFRAAFERVDGVVALVGSNRPQAEQARSLQAVALVKGTRRVVIVPVWATAGATRQLPEDALPALSDALLDNPWQVPPRFVAVMPPARVERDLRRLDFSRRTLATSEAARFGREVGADFVIVTEIDSVRRDQVEVKTTRHPIRTVRGVDTAYTVEEGRARLYARATFAMIDPDARRWVDHESVAVVAEAPFTRARFAGDVRTLDLKQAERDLFDRAQTDRTEHELARSLSAGLSPRLAEAVFADVLRRIP